MNALHMEVQMGLMIETLVAQFALEQILRILCCRVSPPDVAVVGGMRGERLSTESTFERFLAAMLSDMRAKDGASGERLAAVRALVRTLTGMHPKMLK